MVFDGEWPRNADVRQTPTRSWVPNYGVLRNRVVPPVQAELRTLPAGSPQPGARAAMPGTAGGYEAVSPAFGRGPAKEAGSAVVECIRPLVKVIIIFPTSFSVLPWHRLTGRATSA